MAGKIKPTTLGIIAVIAVLALIFTQTGGQLFSAVGPVEQTIVKEFRDGGTVESSYWVYDVTVQDSSESALFILKPREEQSGLYEYIPQFDKYLKFEYAPADSNCNYKLRRVPLTVPLPIIGIFGFGIEIDHYFEFQDRSPEEHIKFSTRILSETGSELASKIFDVSLDSSQKVFDIRGGKVIVNPKGSLETLKYCDKPISTNTVVYVDKNGKAEIVSKDFLFGGQIKADEFSSQFTSFNLIGDANSQTPELQVGLPEDIYGRAQFELLASADVFSTIKRLVKETVTPVVTNFDCTDNVIKGKEGTCAFKLKNTDTASRTFRTIPSSQYISFDSSVIQNTLQAGETRLITFKFDAGSPQANSALIEIEVCSSNSLGEDSCTQASDNIQLSNPSIIVGPIPECREGMCCDNVCDRRIGENEQTCPQDCKTFTCEQGFVKKFDSETGEPYCSQIEEEQQLNIQLILIIGIIIVLVGIVALFQKPVRQKMRRR